MPGFLCNEENAPSLLVFSLSQTWYHHLRNAHATQPPTMPCPPSRSCFSRDFLAYLRAQLRFTLD